MADFESNISIGIDTSQALAAIKNLQRQISEFQTSMARGTAAQAAEASKLQQELVSSINSTGKFSASIRNVQSTTEAFTSALEKNKLSFGQYFKYAAASTKTFGNSFKSEMAVIEKTARERVKDLQTQYIKLGRDASGAMKAIAVRPLTLDLEDLSTKTAIAAQKQQILNQLMKQGSTNLLNFGKNTQWAGRQLMVGFTIPLTIFGSAAAKTFMELEEQVIKFKKVYGDLFTTGPEREKALAEIRELANEFTKYGIAVSETVGIAAEAAAAGFQGVDLQRQTRESVRLSVLGQIEQQKALDTTISLQNAFRLSSENLAEAINFLNAVENQTVVSLDDITTAIPKVAPVIQSLGGDVKDLAFFLAAMKEGGVNASEGANALKSGLASLINPTDKASQMLQGLGINIRSIIERNAGDLKGTVVEFAQALDKLDPLNRARAIEQLFGKFQFARISTLFDNVIKDGTQASRVLDLAGESVAGLAAMAEQELGMTSASAMNKFRKAIEDLQAALAPIGELFLKIVTPIAEFATDALKNFNKLDDGVKTFIAGIVGLFGVIGPVALMTFGLLANGVANIIKGFLAVRNVFSNVGKQSKILGEQTDYMTQKQLQELAVAASLEQAHMNLAQAFTAETNAIEALVKAYDKAIQRQAQYRGAGIPTTISQQAPVKMQTGGVVTTVPGSGKGDKVPALLEPGEAVIPSAMAKKYSGFIHGMIAGTIPGFQKGTFLGMPRSGKSTGKNRDAAEQVYQAFLQSSYRNVPPTNYGHQIAPTSGHSFPIFGLGGVYMSPAGKKVFVKPVMDEKAALAEMRGTQIARQVHGLEAPEQRIVVIADPEDPSRTRRFLALESDLDSKFIQNEPKAIFNEEQYFRQLVASLLRVDKDLSAGNVFGNVVADVGPAGVFSRASGQRDYTSDLPSMEDQAMVNLLGIKGGAKRAFAEATVQLMSKMTADQYHQYMLAEIQKTLPLLKQTIAGFGLTDPAAADAYAGMIKRLEAGLGVNWRRFHEIHSAVKISVPRQAANPKRVPGYASGIVSVPGPKGAGDIMPAMLSPGEAVIPAAQAKKYAPLIRGMVAGNIPGFADGKMPSVTSMMPQFGFRGETPTNVSHFGDFTPRNLLDTLKQIIEMDSEFGETEVQLVKLEDAVDDAGNAITRVVTEVVKLKDAVTETGDALVAGVGFGGTGILEGAVRNNQAYNLAGIEGSALTLDDVVENGNRAAIALAKIEDKSSPVAIELQRLVDEAREASIRLDGTSANQERYSFMLSQGAKALEEAALKDTSISNTAEAREAAERRLLSVQSVYDDAVAQGLSSEEALTKAKLEMEKQLFLSSQSLKDERLTIGVGPQGTGGGKLRDVLGRGWRSSSGPIEYEGGKPKFSTGRDNKRISAMLAQELMQEYGIELDQAAQQIVSGFMSRIIQEIREYSQTASPSRKIGGVGEDLVDGLEVGLRSGEDDVQAAGQKLSQAVAMGTATGTQAAIYRLGGPDSRRVTTDQNKYIADAGPRLFGGSNNAADLLADRLTPAIGELEGVTTRTKTGFETMNSNLMNVSFAFSSIAALTSMFGSELSGINEALFNFSNIVFALSGVMAIVNMLEGVRAKILAKANAQSIGQIFADLPLLFGKLKGGFLKLLPNLLKFARFMGPIAAAFAAFQIAGEIQKQQEAKIKGLGDAAFAAGKKLETIGDILNVEFRSPDRSAQFATAGGLAPGGGERAAAIRESEGFKTAIETSVNEGGFKEDLERLKSATLSEAEFALNNLALQLIATAPEGTDPEAIREFVAALASEAGKAKVDINVDLDLTDKGVFDQIQEDATTSAEMIRIAYANTLDSLNKGASGTWLQGLIGDTTILQIANSELLTSLNNLSSQYSSFLVATETGFLNGTLSAEEYQSQLSSIIAEIASLGNAGTIVIQNMFADFGVEEELKGIEDVNNQLILLEALAAGVDFTEAGIDIKAIDKMDDFFASTEDVEKGTIELEKAQNAVSGAIAKTAEELAKVKYDERANEILIATDALDEQLKANEDIIRLYPDLVEQLGSEEAAMNAVNDERTRSLLLQAEEQDLIDGGTANRDKVITALNALAGSEKLVNDIRGAADMTTYLKNLREQNAVLGWLTSNGMSTADAIQVIGNSTLYAGAAAAKSSGDYNGFVEEMKEILSLQATLSASGGGEKSPFQQAIENLKEQRNAAGDVIAAYNKLRSAGLSVSAAFDAAQDPIIATAVATTKVGTSKWRELVGLVKQAALAIRQSRLLEVFAEREAGNVLLKSFAKIAPMLSRMGLTLDDISGILNDPTLAQAFVDDLKDGVINSQRVLDIINQIPATKKIEILFDMATPEGMMSQFDEAYGRQMDFLDLQERAINRQYDSQQQAADAAVKTAQGTVDAIRSRIDTIQSQVDDKQRNIELSITRPIEDLNETISDLEREIEMSYSRPIADLQEESSDLSRELEMIDRQSEEINEKFDIQAASLEKISELNSDIAERDKERLSVAEALSSGNAAEAAKAMREARIREQQRAREKAAQALEAAREQQLAQVRSSSGKTREDIEQRILEINDSIYELEEKREAKQKDIQEIQDKIYQIELKRRPILDDIRNLEDEIYQITEDELGVAEDAVKTAQDNADALEDQRSAALAGIDAQRLEWDLLKDQANKAMLESDGYLTSLTDAKNMVDKIAAAWRNVGTETAAANSRIQPSPTVPTSSGSTSGGNGTDPVIEEKYPPIGRAGTREDESAVVGKNKYVWNSRKKEWVKTHVGGTKGNWIRVAPKPASPGNFPGDYVDGWTWDYAKGWYSQGGYVSGPGTGTSDSIPARLSDGEFVIRSAIVRKLGTRFLDGLNQTGEVSGYAGGGLVIPGKKTTQPKKSSPAPFSIGPNGVPIINGVAVGGSKSAAKATTKPAAPKPTVASAMAADKKATSQAMAAKPTVNVSAAMAADKRAANNTILYKQGGFQGFEAGFQGMMADVAKNPIVKAIGEAYSSEQFGGKVLRAAVGTLSVPVEMMGSVAKSFVDSAAMIGKGDILGAIGNSFATLPKALYEGVTTAYSGVANAADQKSSMFEQAAQSAIDNNFFGAKTNPEMAALARIIGGSLNIVGDPLTYLGGAGVARGAAVAAAKIGTKATNVARTAASAAPNMIGKAGTATKAFSSDMKHLMRDLSPQSIRANRAVRAEQTSLANQTKQVFDEKIAQLLRNGDLGGANDLTALRKLQNDFVKMDRLSIGPRVNMPEGLNVKNLKDVDPKDLLYMAWNNQGKGNLRELKNVDSPGLYNVTTGNQRRAVGFNSPALNWLYEKGLVRTTPGLSRLKQQMKQSAEMAPDRTDIPQLGPNPMAMLSKTGTSFVSGTFNRRQRSLAGEVGRTQRLFRQYSDLGPLSANISIDNLRRNKTLFGHEFTHVVDKAQDALSMSRINMRPRVALNSTAEARAKATDAILEGGTTRAYNWFQLDANHVRHLGTKEGMKDFFDSYLGPNADRGYQMDGTWYNDYIKRITQAQEKLGIPIHDDYTLAMQQRTADIMKDAGYRLSTPSMERPQKFADSLEKLRELQPDISNDIDQALYRLEEQARRSGMQRPSSSLNRGNMGAPDLPSREEYMRGIRGTSGLPPSLQDALSVNAITSRVRTARANAQNTIGAIKEGLKNGIFTGRSAQLAGQLDKLNSLKQAGYEFKLNDLGNGELQLEAWIDGKSAGYLDLYKYSDAAKGREIKMVNTYGDFQRQGVATALLTEARLRGLNPLHSRVLSQQGSGFAASTGGRSVPETIGLREKSVAIDIEASKRYQQRVGQERAAAIAKIRENPELYPGIDISTADKRKYVRVDANKIKNDDIWDWGDSPQAATGGLVDASRNRIIAKPKYLNTGGQIFKPLGTDKVPAMLTPGEFVMSKYAVQNYGLDKMKAINSGTYNDGSVYNYSVNVNVKSDANPDQIARAVMTQIKQVDSQRIRSNRF